MATAKSKKVSIYTLSRELGVSPATVSRALNNHPTVSAEIRTKVQKAANKKKFRPRFVSNRATNICVLIQQYEGHPLDFGGFLSPVLEGVAQYCRHEELEMSLYSADVQELNQCDIVRELRRRNADGAVVLRSRKQTTFLSQLDDQRFPYLCMFTGNGVASNRLLTFDDEKLAYQAVEHLILLGHRKIGMLIAARHTQIGDRRLEGYRRALMDHGITPDEGWVMTADPNVHRGGLQFGEAAIEELLARVPDMTGVFTSSEHGARGVLSYLYKKGIPVPKRISIVGFDDFPETAYICPPLTTVRVPYLEMGYEGARQVHRLCRGLDVLIPDNVRQALAGELIVRESTAPATTNFEF